MADVENPFTDVTEDQWFYSAVLWAYCEGVINGSTATAFDPDGKIAREQFATILYHYDGEEAVTGGLSGFVGGGTA